MNIYFKGYKSLHKNELETQKGLSIIEQTAIEERNALAKLDRVLGRTSSIINNY